MAINGHRKHQMWRFRGHGIWEPVRGYRDLREGDVFCIQRPDGNYAVDNYGFSVWQAACEPYHIPSQKEPVVNVKPVS